MNDKLSVLCPRSLERTVVSGVPSRCECCNEVLPPLYLRGGQGMLPLPIQFFGLSQHGKTAYLAALTMALQRVNTVWNGFTATPATEYSRRVVQEVNRCFDTGQLPPPTPAAASDCYLLLLNRIPKWGKAALMIRDCSGEAFQGLDVDVQQASFLIKAPLTFMFISSGDLKEGYTMDALMTNYLSAFAAYGVGPELKKIVLVLTKADSLLDSLPADVLTYIMEDPIWRASREEVESKAYGASEIETYMRSLQEISYLIEEWICSRAAGRTMVTLARDSDIEIQFSVVSSTGSAPRAQDNMLSTSWEPSRVLDPLLWALEMELGK